MSRDVTKPTNWPVRPVKTQISLGIRPVWSESSLCTQWIAKGPSFDHAPSKDWSDWAESQANLSLHWTHKHFVDFVMMRLKCYSTMNSSTLNPQICSFQTWCVVKSNSRMSQVSAVTAFRLKSRKYHSPIYWNNPKFLDRPAVISFKKVPNVPLWFCASGHTCLDKQYWSRSDWKSSLVRVYTVCLMSASYERMVNPPCSNFRIITAMFQVSKGLEF